MSSANIEINTWYDSLKDQALDRNEKSSATWSKYKDDLMMTKSLLSSLPKKVKHDVMVPIGSKALMYGKLVHTNEFLVNLGETWFAKRTACQTIEICDRRLKICEEMLQKLEKERELVVSKSTLPAEQEAFGNEERPEIVEFVTEEENEEWKKQHRVREKKYRQELAELRKKEKKPIETEEDLWKHLDELELQEELEDELNRLNAESGSEDEASEENLELNNATNQSEENPGLETEKEVNDKDNFKREKGKTEGRVSFSGVANSSDDDDDEPLRLEFQHSDREPVASDPQSKEINSPGDIYYRYLQLSSRTPLSILKSQVNPNQEKELERIQSVETPDNSDDEGGCVSEKVIPTGILLNDIFERSSVSLDNDLRYESKTRKVSKFKANRTKPLS